MPSVMKIMSESTIDEKIQALEDCLKELYRTDQHALDHATVAIIRDPNAYSSRDWEKLKKRKK